MKRKLTGDRNQCPTCGEYFNSTYACDAHRTGPFGHGGQPARRRCLTVNEMSAHGMRLNRAGFWVGNPHTPASLAQKIAVEAGEATPASAVQDESPR